MTTKCWTLLELPDTATWGGPTSNGAELNTISSLAGGCITGAAQHHSSLNRVRQ